MNGQNMLYLTPNAQQQPSCSIHDKRDLLKAKYLHAKEAKYKSTTKTIATRHKVNRLADRMKLNQLQDKTLTSNFQKSLHITPKFDSTSEMRKTHELELFSNDKIRTITNSFPHTPTKDCITANPPNKALIKKMSLAPPRLQKTDSMTKIANKPPRAGAAYIRIASFPLLDKGSQKSFVQRSVEKTEFQIKEYPKIFETPERKFSRKKWQSVNSVVIPGFQVQAYQSGSTNPVDRKNSVIDRLQMRSRRQPDKVGSVELQNEQSEPSLEAKDNSKYDCLKVQTIQLDQITNARAPISTYNEKIAKLIVKNNQDRIKAYAFLDSVSMPTLDHKDHGTPIKIISAKRTRNRDWLTEDKLLAQTNQATPIAAAESKTIDDGESEEEEVTYKHIPMQCFPKSISSSGDSLEMDKTNLKVIKKDHLSAVRQVLNAKQRGQMSIPFDLKRKQVMKQERHFQSRGKAMIGTSPTKLTLAKQVRALNNKIFPRQCQNIFELAGSTKEVISHAEYTQLKTKQKQWNREERRFQREIQQLQMADYISDEKKVPSETTSFDSHSELSSQSFRARKILLKDERRLCDELGVSDGLGHDKGFGVQLPQIDL